MSSELIQSNNLISYWHIIIFIWVQIKPFITNKSPLSHFEKQSFKWSNHNPLRLQLFVSTYNTYKIEFMLNY